MGHQWHVAGVIESGKLARIMAVFSFAIVLLSTYIGMLQRGDAGPCGGVGARLALVEAALLSGGGAVAGILMSIGLAQVLRMLVPASLPMVMEPAWWPVAGAITLTGSLLGGAGPAMKTYRTRKTS